MRTLGRAVSVVLLTPLVMTAIVGGFIGVLCIFDEEGRRSMIDAYNHQFGPTTADPRYCTTYVRRTLPHAGITCNNRDWEGYHEPTPFKVRDASHALQLPTGVRFQAPDGRVFIR